MKIVGIVPARSGSKGLPNKNIRPIAGRTLLERAIDFGLEIGLNDVIVSTDSLAYAEIAIKAGATIPGMRGDRASGSTAMEPEVIDDLNKTFTESDIERPDVAVWLRPTFVFRSISATKECLRMVVEGEASAGRVVTRVDPRIYQNTDGFLCPRFDDGGKSMVRRQELDSLFHVFDVDVFHWPSKKCPENYLGSSVSFVVAPKLCSVDIDSEEDFVIAEALLRAFGCGTIE